MLTQLKDYLIRKVARVYVIRLLDGKKTIIMRLLQGLTMTVAALVELFPGSAIAAEINTQWLLLVALLNHVGLEFAIQDANAKERLGE